MGKITKEEAIAKLTALRVEVPEGMSYNGIVKLLGEHEVEETVVVSKSVMDSILKRLDNQDTTISRLQGATTFDAEKLLTSLQGNGSFSSENALLDGEARTKYAQKMLSMIRCVVRVLDPLKAKFTVEKLVVINPIVGAREYNVELNITTHIPYIVYLALSDKTYNQYDENFSSGDAKVGGETSGGSSVKKAYDINLLRPLTEKELNVLRKKQILDGGTTPEKLDFLVESADSIEVLHNSKLKDLGYNI